MGSTDLLCNGGHVSCEGCGAVMDATAVNWCMGRALCRECIVPTPTADPGLRGRGRALSPVPMGRGVHVPAKAGIIGRLADWLVGR